MENRELPEDVMRRVLSLLPLRDLFRLRCVCRQWLSLPFSLLFLDPLPPSPSSTCVFLFRLLARRVNLAYSYTYKSTGVTYNVDYDRQLAGSFAFSDDNNDDDRRSHRSSSHDFLAPSPLLEHLHTGTLEVAAAAGGLLLFGLRPQPDSLRLFVYNPATKALRVLPPTRWAPQKLSILAGDYPSPYRILSLALHFRPTTEYRLFSFEAFDPAAATAASDTWHILSHVSANLSSDELHGNTRKVMGFVNSKALWGGHGSFLYWSPTLDHREEKGLHTHLSACPIDKGYFYRIPGLPFKTTFASMWPTPTGLQLMCGVAHQQEALASPPPSHPQQQWRYPIPPPELHNVTMDVTLSVEVWELHQTKEQPKEELQEVYGGRYGDRELPQGTHWQLVERVPLDLWAQLTRKKGTNGHKVACVVAPSSHNNPQVLVVADEEEEWMVLYSPLQKTWKLSPSCSNILSNLFHDVDLDYYKVLPWTISFQPSNTPV